MMSSDEEEDPRVLTAEHVKQLLEKCSKLTNKALGNENPNDNSIEQVINAAFSAKKQLKSLLPIIKDDSKGRVDSQTVYNEVHEFLYLFQVFSHGAGLSKEDRADVLDALLTLDALEKDLQESWNQNRDPPVIKDSFKRALPSENEASTSSSNLAITPIKPPYKKIKFAKISPKADLLPVFECHMCVKKFSYLKTLRRHLKTAHQSDLPNEGLKEASNKVTCRICNTKQSRDQLNKHLQMTHNIKKKGLGGVLRGFWTLDDVYWYPLWLAKGEDDPPSDLMVPVQNGRITVYGNEYSVENKDVGDLVKIEDNFEQKTSQNKLSRNASNEGDTNRNKNNNGSLRDSRLDKNDNVINYTEERMESHVLNEEESEGISPNGEQACQGPSVNYCISEDGAELPTTKNSSPETTSSRSGPEAKCDEDEKLLNMEDEMAKLGYLASPEDARPHNPENIGKSFKSSAARCLSMEEFDVNDEFFNEGESFVEVAQILTPTETTIADSLKSGLQGDTNCNKTPKLLVEVFLVEVKDGTFWSAEEEEFAIDSSFEHGDSKDDSESIRDMKKARIERRNAVDPPPKLCNLEGNAEVVKEFEKFLKMQKFETASNDSNLSTIRKMTGHLFRYEDSLLNFQNSSKENYLLKRHFTPQEADFLEVEDPTIVNGWLNSVAGESGKLNPGDRKEKCKSHARWRDYVREKLENTDFGNTAEDILKKDNILKNLDKISTKIKNKQIFSKLDKLDKQLRQEKKQARQVLYPQDNIMQQQCVKKWFSSEAAAQEEKECSAIYKKCISGSKTGAKPFLRYANFSRWNVVLEDRNRRSGYEFTNAEFASRQPKWLPKVKKNSKDNESDRFETLPDSWNPDLAPNEGEEPSCYLIKRSGKGKGLKGQKEVRIILTPRSLEICLRFQDMKEMLLDVKDTDSFFVNLKNEPIAPLQNTPGSLLHKFGIACGIAKPTVNTLRRAAETKIQASPLMKSAVENLNCHSSEVGLEHYDLGADNSRANFFHQLSAMESPGIVEDVPEKIKEKRKQTAVKERELRVQRAKETLIVDKMKKRNRSSKSCKLKPKNRLFLQEFFSTFDKKKFSSDVHFPGDEVWQKIFYRVVDSQIGVEGDRIRVIEEEVFFQSVKAEVENMMGPWCGTPRQNECADSRIAISIKSAFKVYEKNKEDFEDSYFKF